MNKYLNQIAEGTGVDDGRLPEKPAPYTRLITDNSSSDQVTKSDKELIEGTEDIIKSSETIYAAKAVKVRKYQLYKNRGD